MTWGGLYDIMRRYDPGLLLSQDEVERYLTARALCPHMAYRVDGDRIVDAMAFALGREEVDRDVDETLEAQKEWPRPVLAARARSTSFAAAKACERGPPLTGRGKI